MNIPANNSKIIFSKIPKGSYASINEIYDVAIEGNTIFIKLASGAGTFDSAWQYRAAKWQVAA